MEGEQAFAPDEQWAEKALETVIEKIQNHPFEYGMEHALNDPRSYIAFEDDGYVFRFPPASVEEETWHGDCVTDAALVMQSLQNEHMAEGAHYEYMRYEFPGIKGFAIHYRVITGNGTPIEHSQFYRNLNPDQRTSQVPLSPIDDGLPNINDHIPFKQGMFNYKEFSHNGMNHTVLVQVKTKERAEHEIALPAVDYNVIIFVQDENGDVVKRYQVDQSFTHSLIRMITQPEVPEDYIKFLMGNNLVVYEDGEGHMENFDDPVIQSHMVKTVQSLLCTTIRGELRNKKEQGENQEK